MAIAAINPSSESMANHDLDAPVNVAEAFPCPFQDYLKGLYEKYISLTEGHVANYIPELALANPNWFAICVITTTGQLFEVGDCEQPFTIQSISKPFVYGLALEDHGRDYVNSKVGVEPSGEAFNAIVLDETTNRPYNPMVNAGAIATTDLIQGESATERLKRILQMFEHYTGREHHVNVPVFLSEKATGDRNRGMAYLMRNFGMVSDRVEETLDLYFQQCSIMVHTRDLAMMAATLANRGINPITRKTALNPEYVQDVVSVMLSCGMYNYSGEWAYKVGMPAKSGVSGGITVVVPGKLGIGVFSPRLDDKGNSIRGVQACTDIARDFGLHLLSCSPTHHHLEEWLIPG
jgi:glutaminase